MHLTFKKTSPFDCKCSGKAVNLNFWKTWDENNVIGKWKEGRHKEKTSGSRTKNSYC